MNEPTVAVKRATVEAAEAATEYCREHVGWIETKVLAARIAKAMVPAFEEAYREGYGKGHVRGSLGQLAIRVESDWRVSKAFVALKGTP